MAPHSLMSLWDMLRFYAEKFVELSKTIEQIVVGLRLNAGKSAVLDEHGGTIPFKLREIHTMCESLGLTMTAAGFERVSDVAKLEPPLSPDLFENSLLDARRRLEDELKAKFFFAVSAEDAAHLEVGALHFGADVRSKFPKAIFDIDEAAMCLGLGRSTAAVFHLLRVTEAALRAMSQCVNVTVASTNWGEFLNAFRQERIRRGSNWPELQVFQDFYARIAAIKDAYRNPTFHEIETIYTEREAKRIFLDTEAFMQKIASRMDENGLPLA